MVQAHTLRLGNVYMYAQDVTMPTMFKRRNQIEIPIQNGDPKWYYGAKKLRQFSCLVTLYGSHKDMRAELETINDKVVPCVSIYIGAFKAMVEIEGNIINGAPNVLKAKLNIQEVV